MRVRARARIALQRVSARARTHACVGRVLAERRCAERADERGFMRVRAGVGVCMHACMHALPSSPPHASSHTPTHTCSTPATGCGLGLRPPAPAPSPSSSISSELGTATKSALMMASHSDWANSMCDQHASKLASTLSSITAAAGLGPPAVHTMQLLLLLAAPPRAVPGLPPRPPPRAPCARRPAGPARVGGSPRAAISHPFNTGPACVLPVMPQGRSGVIRPE